MCDRQRLFMNHLANPDYDWYNYQKSQSGDSFLICAIAGVLVIWVLISLFKSSTTPVQQRNPMNPIYIPATIVETSAKLVTNAVSGRVVTLEDSGLLNLDQCTFLNVPRNENTHKILVADCKDGNWKKLTDGEKTKIDERMKAWLSKSENQDVVIMVFAPWCPHCHNSMPEFVKLYEKMSGDFKMLIVDAEACPRDTFTEGKPTCLHPLKYFPTFLLRQKGKPVFKEVDLKELTNFFSSMSDSPTGDTDEGTSAMLAQFF